MWTTVVLILALGICVATDLRSRKIYNAVIVPGLAAAVLLHTALSGWQGFAGALLGFATGFSLLLVPYFFGGIGAGDVKLLALIGALKGTGFVLATAVYMALLGGILALLVILFRKGARQRLWAIAYFLAGIRSGCRFPLEFDKLALKVTYPYGLAIAGGAVIHLWNGGWLL